MKHKELLKLLWAIHIAAREYESRVPFGYRPRKEEWIYYKMTFYEIMEEVIETLEREWRRWRKAVREQKFDGDFIKWLAQTDYFTDKVSIPQWCDCCHETMFFCVHCPIYSAGRGFTGCMA